MALSAEDKWNVVGLATKMYFALDAKDAESYAASFAEDGRLSHPYGEMASRAEVLAWVQGYIAQGHQDGGRHGIVSPVVEEDPAGARLKCYVLRMKVDIDPPSIATGGLDVVMVRHGAEWRVQHKKVSVDWMPGS